MQSVLQVLLLALYILYIQFISNFWVYCLNDETEFDVYVDKNTSRKHAQNRGAQIFKNSNHSTPIKAVHSKIPKPNNTFWEKSLLWESVEAKPLIYSSRGTALPWNVKFYLIASVVLLHPLIVLLFEVHNYIIIFIEFFSCEYDT